MYAIITISIIQFNLTLVLLYTRIIAPKVCAEYLLPLRVIVYSKFLPRSIYLITRYIHWKVSFIKTLVSSGRKQAKSNGYLIHIINSVHLIGSFPIDKRISRKIRLAIT